MNMKQAIFLLFLSGSTIFTKNIDLIPPHIAEKIEQYYLTKRSCHYTSDLIKAAINEAKNHTCFPNSRLLVIKPRTIDVITLWDLSAGKLIQSFKGKEYPTFNNDHTMLAVRATTNTPHKTFLYNILTGQCTHTIEGEYPLFSPGGSIVVTTTLERHLEAQESTLWDVTTGKPISTLKGEFVLFSPDETLLIVKARNDSTRIEEIRVLNAANGEIIHFFENGYPSFSSDGKQLTIKTYKGYDIIWEKEITPI